MTALPLLAKLSQLFGRYKAEWLREKIYDLFSEPSYFPELKTPRPCVIEGGRGTGKTTVLKGLSYEGQYAFVQKNPKLFCEIEYVGLYHRVDTNHVMAFSGMGISDEVWGRYFSHYFNLIIAESALFFVKWYNENIQDTVRFESVEVKKISTSLCLIDSDKVDLLESIENTKIDFQSKVNTLADGPRISLSMQEAPLSILFNILSNKKDFKGKVFFLLIDEYENFEAYQQRIINTIIKHSGESYSFKLGVRELGWKNKTTLNSIEPLNSPADYVLINVVGKLSGAKFDDFARQVCNARVAQSPELKGIVNFDISKLLPGLTNELEASRLGAGDVAERVRKSLGVSAELLSDLEAYFLNYWALNKALGINAVYAEKVKEKEKWAERFENYRYAVLFTIKHGKVGVRKYYCGWDEMVRMSGCNIRYLMELIEQSLAHGEISPGVLEISQENQTLAAQSIGRKNISLLSGMTIYGAQLTRLLLGLGRFFQILASDPAGHAPEINQFKISWENCTDKNRLEEILRLAVMHLALVKTQGSKLTSQNETKDYEYMIHPIFSSFFEYSNRKKRKITLDGNDLLSLIDNPKQALNHMLAVAGAAKSIGSAEKYGIPTQMTIFGEYYE